ncbi:hypothetical protein AVEN_260105-1 [Araneus ventricosus]|uniref:Uncharacterized protein n=1 Tax=Araneus ventricosus TaxID=182803 RepID=A0A4Y2T1A9_ARAVE|nr:hypothetical protein AVEN_260105-1 [Araneus ventricosus]
MNSCNLFEIEYGQFTEGLRKLCSFPNDEFRSCFDEANSQFKNRYTEIVAGMHGPDESPAVGKARVMYKIFLNL